MAPHAHLSPEGRKAREAAMIKDEALNISLRLIKKYDLERRTAVVIELEEELWDRRLHYHVCGHGNDPVAERGEGPRWEYPILQLGYWLSFENDVLLRRFDVLEAKCGQCNRVYWIRSFMKFRLAR